MTLEEWKEIKYLDECNDLDAKLDGCQLDDAFWVGYEFAMADRMFGETE